MRLSDAMRRAGLSVEGLREAHVVEGPERKQAMAWKNAALKNRAGAGRNGQEPATEDATLRQQAAMERRGPYLLSNDPAILLGARDLPFLKKDRGAYYRLQRRKLLTDTAYANYLAAMSGVMRREIASRDEPEGSRRNHD